MTAKQHWMRFACAAALATVTIGLTARSAAAAPPTASTSSTSTERPVLAAYEARTGRFLYAVNQAAATRGSISVYDIGAGHRLVKTIETVRDVDDVKGVAASTATGRLYVAYRTRSGVGMIYCLSVYDDAVLWNRAIDPDIDRLAIHPGGQLLYVPTWRAARPTLSTSWMPARAMSFARCISLIDRTIPCSRYLGHSFRRARPRTEAGNTCI